MFDWSSDVCFSVLLCLYSLFIHLSMVNSCDYKPMGVGIATFLCVRRRRVSTCKSFGRGCYNSAQAKEYSGGIPMKFGIGLFGMQTHGDLPYGHPEHARKSDGSGKGVSVRLD